MTTADRTYKADVLIEGEKIKEIGQDLKGDEVIDATGHGDPSPGSTTVSVIGDIKNANELSRWCKAVALSLSLGMLPCR